MFEPRKRKTLDGKVWWCVYNKITQSFSPIIAFGKYKTKKACNEAITNYLLTRKF